MFHVDEYKKSTKPSTTVKENQRLLWKQVTDANVKRFLNDFIER